MIKDFFLRALGWLALPMACLLPVSCLMEEEDPVFVLNINLPETVDDSDYLVIVLADTNGRILDSLFQGATEDRLLRRPAPHYDGGEAWVVIQEYSLAAGLGDSTGTARLEPGRLTEETRIRINSGLGVNETLAPLKLVPASSPFPPALGMDIDTQVVLQWRGGERFVDPQPEYRVYLGVSLGEDEEFTFRASTRAESLRVDSLLRDTTYAWRVETWRAGNWVAGPRWHFRTMPYPPAELAYVDTVTVFIGDPFTLRPRYVGGSQTLFRVEPPLPAGLGLDSATGVIQGTAAAGAETDSSRHEVTVSNAAGRIRAALVLRVRKPPPLEIAVPEALREADSLRALLLDSAGGPAKILYRGPVPAEGLLRLEAEARSDGEAELLLHGFQGDGVTWEFRYRLDRRSGWLDSLPPYALPSPRWPVPGDGAWDSSAAPRLSWSRDTVFQPLVPALARVRLGTSNPPPLHADSLREDWIRAPALLPDTVYYWKVEYFRPGPMAPGPSVSGPVWSFRTRPLAPRAFAYPADTVLNIDAPVRLDPAYAGGAARFRIAPSLPAGLALDSLTGRISGTPAGAGPRVEYVVTAANASGSLEARLFLRVDHRMVRVTLPEAARQADSVAAFLVSPLGNLMDTLWGGPVPVDLRVGRSTWSYDGIRAVLLVLAFRQGRAVEEWRFAVSGPGPVAEPLPLPDLPAPHQPVPAETAAAADTLLDLAWKTSAGLPPAPRYRLYLGLANPPPLYRDDLDRETVPSVALLPDTLYHWRVEVLRAGRSLPGPVWSFRTRPPMPRSVAFGDLAFHVGQPASALPAYQGGGRARFTVAPALPEGLAMDSLTGRITGTPKAVSGPMDYTVAAANPSGRVTAGFVLRVLPRLIDFLLPDTADQCERVFVELRDSDGGIDTLWDGPPPGDRRVRSLAPGYGGGEASLRIQGFRGAVLHWESRRRVNQDLGLLALETLPTLLPTPKLRPENGAMVSDTLLDLEWSQAGDLDPPSLGAVYLGLANPPPLYLDSVAGRHLKSVALKPDTTYYWSVETVRAGRRTQGSVWTFRTPTSPPSLLSYPAADSILWRDSARTITPAWKCGRGARFSVSPPLPAGLDLDSLTGAISGRPLAAVPRAGYVITLRNDAGSLQSTFHFRVGFTANLVARWEGEEDSGTTLVDNSGNGHHGTLQGVTRVPGVKGKALAFDGSAWARIAVRDALQVNGFTLSLWYRQADGEAVEPLLEFSEPDWLIGINLSTNTTGWGVPSPGAAYCNIRPADATPAQHGSVRERNIIVTPPGIAVENQWNHMAVTFDPRTWTAAIHVNGRREAEKILQPNFTPLSKGRIHLGFRPADLLESSVNLGFHGEMDQVEIFDGPLDSAGIAAKYRVLSP